MTKVANFDYKYNYNPVLLWQYTDAENIKNIIANEQNFLDVAITQFQQEFDEDIFNLETCDTNGLDLWGRLLGVQRPIILGEQASNDQYRLLLKVRFSVLIWDGSCAGLTKIIKSLFPNALFQVTDNYDMTVSIDFAGGISREQMEILSMGYEDPLTETYVHTFLPRPAGVEYNITMEGQWARVLGFEGMTDPNLENSTTNMGGAYDCDPDDHTGETGTENADGGVFYK